MIFVQQEIVHYCRFSNLMSLQLEKTTKGKPVEAIHINAFPLSGSHL